MKKDLKFWIPIESKDRVEAIKREFENAYSYAGADSPLIVTEDGDCYELKIEDIRNLDLVHLFHAGISYMQTKSQNQKTKQTWKR